MALEACGSRRLLGEAFAGVSAVDRKPACQIAQVAACQSLCLKAKALLDVWPVEHALGCVWHQLAPSHKILGDAWLPRHAMSGGGGDTSLKACASEHMELSEGCAFRKNSANVLGGDLAQALRAHLGLCYPGAA